MLKSPDLECDEDPAVCDCAYHDNARRAAATHLDNDPPRCNQCGREPPTHARHCPKVSPFGATADEALRAAVLDLAIVLQEGGTLILTGPNSVISPNDRQYGATLEDSRGELSANAYGVELGAVLVNLLVEWKRLQQLDAHQAEHDRGAN